jgi:sulfotransferase family protein
LGRDRHLGGGGVTEIVWLASYPKSGNTWFRILVANLSATEGPVDINDLPERGGIASGRGGFEFVTLLDSGLLSHDEADILRPRVYEELAGGPGLDDTEESNVSSAPRLVKVHDAYTDTPLGEPLLAGRRGAKGAILITRDPRAIALSLAHHRHTTIDEAIAFMNSQAAAFCATLTAQPNQLRQKLFGWSDHVKSWLDQGDIPVHVVRYEDLSTAPVEILLAAMAFAGHDVRRSDAERAAEFASFARLQAQEREKGFGEWGRGGAGKLFFRRGESAAWRRELTREQILCIEGAHAPMMGRLGYHISTCENRAETRISVREKR